MTGHFFGGNHRQHHAENVIVAAHDDDAIFIDTGDKVVELHQRDVTYAAWFQLLAAKPGETVNILRRVA